MLHIGDSYACDYCGAKRFGFDALLLDRSDNPSVVAYQDWLEAPDYEGKTVEDVQANTIKSLDEVVRMLNLKEWYATLIYNPLDEELSLKEVRISLHDMMHMQD